MNNLVLFLNAFLSYLLLFLLIVALVVFAVFCGVKVRQIRNSKKGDGEKEAGDDISAATTGQE